MSHLSGCMALYSCMQVVNGKGEQVHLRVSTQIAESHFWFDVNTEVCLAPISPHPSASNRSAYGA